VELGDANAAVARVEGGGIGGWEEEADELQKEGRMGLDNGECPAVDDIRVCFGTAMFKLTRCLENIRGECPLFSSWSQFQF
jgi:hypothetical protein